MKKFSFLMALVCAASMAFAADATMTGGTNSYDDFIVNDKAAVKVGTSKLGGDMTVTVGAGATSLTLYAVAWKGVSGLSLNITAPAGVTITPASITLTPNDVITGTAKDFTISNEDDYKFTFAISGATEGAVFTFTTATAKRFVMWGATYTAGEVVDVPATAIELDHATLALEQFASATLVATLTPGNATTAVVWSSSDESVATVSNGKVYAVAAGTANITATAGEGVSAICAVTVTAAETTLDCATAAEKALSVAAVNEEYGNGTEFTVIGYVTEIVTEYSEQYNNISFWMADAVDGGRVIEAFRAVPESATKLPVVGDRVKVVGKLTKYGSTPFAELKAGCTIEILSSATSLESVEAQQNVRKVVENGQIFIEKNGVRYNVAGQAVR